MQMMVTLRPEVCKQNLLQAVWRPIRCIFCGFRTKTDQTHSHSAGLSARRPVELPKALKMHRQTHTGTGIIFLDTACTSYGSHRRIRSLSCAACAMTHMVSPGPWFLDVGRGNSSLQLKSILKLTPRPPLVPLRSTSKGDSSAG